MFLFLSVVIAFSPQSFGKEPDFQGTFKKLSLQAIEFRDLCTGKIVHIPKNAKIDLWSFHCGNCRQKIEDTSSFSILINVDEFKDERSKACEWIKSKRLRSLSDAENLIKSQMGGGFPVPTELGMENFQVKKVKIGYWRTSGSPNRKYE